MRAPYPEYYTPPGVAKPAHCPWLAPSGIVSEAAVHTPDGQIGLYWGISYDPKTRGLWQKSADGWYVLLHGRSPNDCARLQLIEGYPITGTKPDQVWIVPQLLRWHPEARLMSAVPSVLQASASGAYDWLPPAHLRPLMERLRAASLWNQVPDLPTITDAEFAQLAIDVLAVNYHISQHELALAGWIDTRMVVEIVQAAAGITALREDLQRGAAHAAG